MGEHTCGSKSFENIHSLPLESFLQHDSISSSVDNEISWSINWPICTKNVDTPFLSGESGALSTLLISTMGQR